MRARRRRRAEPRLLIEADHAGIDTVSPMEEAATAHESGQSRPGRREIVLAVAG
ncbi:hypothetical protein [Nocardiopsis rhodophaea]|uniref:hypothetical protein n=1 Tax=Nocardiopsis rhodophaea TaxID=280238 RepID=UPI0031CE7573